MKNTPQREVRFFEGGSQNIVKLKDGTAFITLNIEALPKESAQSMLDRLDNLKNDLKCEGLFQWFWGGIDPKTKKTDRKIAQYVQGSDTPTLWLNGDGNPNPKLTAIQVLGIRGAKNLTYLNNEQGAFRKSYQDNYGIYTYVGGATGISSINNESDVVQTEAAFEAIRALLRLNGTSKFHHVARTWIYMDRLLTWYDPFNAVRTQFFNKLNIFDMGLVPSSTGIGAINNEQTAISLSAFAISSPDQQVKFAPVVSPLQCPADDYKSSFSRAHLIDHPNYRQLLVSGTASILQGGASAHVGDIDAQIKLTMEVVKAMLDDNEFTWDDVSRAICYFKDIKDVGAFYQWMEKNEVNEFPMVCVQADVCRDELLFEIELDTLQAK